MKKWLKAALCVLLAILLIVGGYVAYVFIDYHRIGDMALAPSDGGAAAVRTDTPYTVLSYNIGFGAYEDDYGFFMDGGTESRAWSEERLTKNLSEISAFLTEQSPDFLLAQEVDIGSTRSYRGAGGHERRVLPELRLAVPDVPPAAASRRVPLRPADPFLRRHHLGRACGTAGGGRLHEAAGPGPVLFRQPHPRGRQ